MQIASLLNFIERLENNKKIVYFLLGIMIVSFGLLMSFKLLTPEIYPDYHLVIQPLEKSCSLSDFDHGNTDLRLYMLCVSLSIFHNDKILPFVYAVLLLPIAYLFSAKITNRPVIGLISCFVLSTSYDFTQFSISASYDQLWALLFIGSMYLILKKPSLSVPLFVLSILCKALPLIYFPMILYYIKQTSYNIKKKIVLVSSFIGIEISSLIYWIVYFHNQQGVILLWKPTQFIVGLILWLTLMTNDFLIVEFIPFVLLGLYLIRKHQYAKTLFVFIFGIILSMAFLQGFTNMNNQPYRFAPLIVFYGTSLGMVLINLLSFFAKHKKVNKENDVGLVICNCGTPYSSFAYFKCPKCNLPTTFIKFEKPTLEN